MLSRPLIILACVAAGVATSSSDGDGEGGQFYIVNGQIYTPGLAIIDAPQPNTPEGGDTLQVAIDVSGDSVLQQLQPITNTNDETGFFNITIFLTSTVIGLNLTISNGTTDGWTNSSDLDPAFTCNSSTSNSGSSASSAADEGVGISISDIPPPPASPPQPPAAGSPPAPPGPLAPLGPPASNGPLGLPSPASLPKRMAAEISGLIARMQPRNNDQGFQNAGCEPILAQEPGSTVKHVNWVWPDCLVGDGNTNAICNSVEDCVSGTARGDYNVSIHQAFRLNGQDYYTIFNLPIAVTNSIPSQTQQSGSGARPKCALLNNPLQSNSQQNGSVTPLPFQPYLGGDVNGGDGGSSSSGSGSGSGSGTSSGFAVSSTPIPGLSSPTGPVGDVPSLSVPTPTQSGGPINNLVPSAAGGAEMQWWVVGFGVAMGLLVGSW